MSNQTSHGNYSLEFLEVCKAAVEVCENGACNPVPIIMLQEKAVTQVASMVGTDATSVEYAPLRLLASQVAELVGYSMTSYFQVDGDNQSQYTRDVDWCLAQQL